MCSALAQQGVAVVVAAPHMNHPRFRISAAAVRRGVARLQAACDGRRLGLQILPGAEVYLQPELLRQIDDGSVLTVADRGRHLLLELPAGVVPPMERIIFALQLRQITPVLSHPERHRRLIHRPGLLEELVGRGCLVQITGGALLGAFGPAPRRAAELFLERELVHLVGSDAHSAQAISRVGFAEVRRRLVELIGPEHSRRLLCETPAGMVGAGRESEPAAGVGARDAVTTERRSRA
jgi:protein-tyrosine phosphatase